MLRNLRAKGADRRRMALLVLFAVVLMVFASVHSGWSQTPTPDQLQQLQQMQQAGRGGQGAAVPDLPTSVVQQPDTAPSTNQSRSANLPPSRLEQILSQRAGANLTLFGYDILGSGRAVTISQSGGMQDDYVLGPGDEIVITLRGQENSEIRTAVNRDGQVMLPRLAPISAAGRSFGSFRQDVGAAVHRAYVATDAFVSVGRIRQISVLVSGEVNNPGQRTVSGLASVVDAILLSGGIKKSGSLRNIRVERGGRMLAVDLYSVLTDRSGASRALQLADGDRILVPRLGQVVAATGLVRQPGIYELSGGQKTISVRGLIALAGGQEVRGRYRLSVLRLVADGRSTLVDSGENDLVRDSEILFVQLGADQTVDSAKLGGQSDLRGLFPITRTTTLADVLRAPGAMGRSPYTIFGLISRKDPQSLLRSLVAFTPASILNGTENLQLQTDDVVRVISLSELKLLITATTRFREQRESQEERARNPLAAADPNADLDAAGATGAKPGAVSAQGGGVLANALQSGVTTNQADVARQRSIVTSLAGSDPTQPSNQPQGGVPQDGVPQQVPTNADGEVRTLAAMASQLDVDELVLIHFLLDHEATIDGAVRGPGVYIVGPSVTVPQLMAAAGGPDSWADESAVSLLTTTVDTQTGRSETKRASLPLRQGQLTSYIVRPGDQFHFNRVFTDADVGEVTLQGEVRFPGSYKLVRGEHLSEVLSQAGGLTNVAYPYGTVFLRKSIAAAERQGYLRTASEVQDQLITAMTRIGSDKLDPNTFAALQSFVSDLRNQKGVGRIAIIADPSVLTSKPELDPLLESGDLVYIPQRPSTISVLGQVMQPGSYPYRSGQSLDDFIARAGGYARLADKNETFVVLPDGSARKVDRSWLSFDKTALPPGTTIVVPRDMTPLDLRQTIIDVSQIFSQFAIAIASVAVLSKQ